MASSTLPITSALLKATLKFREWIGGEDKINEWCHNLAVEGGRRLAERWGTRVMDPNGELTWNMVRLLSPHDSPHFLIAVIL
ncbi:hypothetical protein H0H93_002996 [Arthromyces matolae]|nr:hypothetical protein H0H93_002996 [Arthromyces matolae]